MLSKNNKGFTLLELMFVIIIIAVLTSFVMPHFIKVIDKAQKVTDEANLKSLNAATEYCKYVDTEDYKNIFLNLETNYRKLEYLQSRNLLEKIPSAESENKIYYWEDSLRKWILQNRNKEKDNRYIHVSKEEEEKLNLQGTWLFPIEMDEYNVDVILNLADKGSAAGLFVDCFLTEGHKIELDKKDNGSLILKEKNNGKSSSVFEYQFNYLNSPFIPNKESKNGEKWWDSYHTLSFSIKENRRLEVSIDHNLVFDDYYLPKVDNSVEKFTGIYIEKGSLHVKEIEIY